MSDPYISEIKYLGGPALDFVEVAVDAGTDVSDIVVTVYFSNGRIRTENSLDGLPYTTISGRDVYVIDTTTSDTFNGVAWHNAVSLSDDTGVYSFVSFSDTDETVTAVEGAADTLTATEIGEAGSGSSLETTNGGASYHPQGTPTSGTIPCLTTGALIDTAKGRVKIEALVAGDRVRTLDGSHKPLRVVMRKFVPAAVMRANPKLYPVRICAGALGKGLPENDMLVSRQHRMLVSSPVTRRMFDADSVLVAAIRLTELPGVFVDTSVEGIEYFHLLFDAHEVIIADGTPTESLYLGEEAINALPSVARTEIETLFPCRMNVASGAGDTAMPVPDGPRQKRLVMRHIRNDMDILRDFVQASN